MFESTHLRPTYTALGIHPYLLRILDPDEVYINQKKDSRFTFVNGTNIIRISVVHRGKHEQRSYSVVHFQANGVHGMFIIESFMGRGD